MKFDDKLKEDEFGQVWKWKRRTNSFMANLIERYNEQPNGMLRLSIVAAAMYDYGHQIARLDKLVEHDHRGETGREGTARDVAQKYSA